MKHICTSVDLRGAQGQFWAYGHRRKQSGRPRHKLTTVSQLLGKGTNNMLITGPRSKG